MGKKGVNPKAWFYGFGRHLNTGTRATHVRRALAGSAAEQWLNMELNAYLLGVLPLGLYTYPEASKRDVCVFSFEHPEQHEDDHLVEAAIETKVVYRQYGKGAIRGRVSKMAVQLERTLEAEQACKAVGLVLGVWTNWASAKPRRARTARRSSLREFSRLAGGEVRDAARERGFRAAKPTMETLVDAGKVQVGPWEVEVALVGQYFVR